MCLVVIFVFEVSTFVSEHNTVQHQFGRGLTERPTRVKREDFAFHLRKEFMLRAERVHCIQAAEAAVWPGFGSMTPWTINFSSGTSTYCGQLVKMQLRTDASVILPCM